MMLLLTQDSWAGYQRGNSNEPISAVLLVTYCILFVFEKHSNVSDWLNKVFCFYLKGKANPEVCLQLQNVSAVLCKSMGK